MKKLILITLSVCFTSLLLLAQTESTELYKDKAIYVDFGGNSLLYSINIEKSLSSGYSPRLALGIGAEYLSSLTLNNLYYYNSLCLIPTANLLFGKNSHFLETGLACLFAYGKGNFTPSARIGYRYQPKNGGFIFRVAYTPLLTGINFHYGGISLGYCL